jgi:hypothetical protein
MAFGEKFDFVGTLIIEYCSMTSACHSEPGLIKQATMAAE